MKLIRLAALPVVIFLTACASTPFITPSATQSVDSPPAGKAQIVFLNPANSISGAFLVGLYDVKTNDRTFYGMLGPKTKMVQNVEPGKHLFMAHTTLPSVVHFLEADVEAGKRYYAILRFVYGNGLQLRPIKLSGPAEFSSENPKFAEWLKECQLVDQTEQVSEWYKKYKNYVDEAQAKAWADWQKKNESQRGELTLNRNDFIGR